MLYNVPTQLEWPSAGAAVPKTLPVTLQGFAARTQYIDTSEYIFSKKVSHLHPPSL